MKSSTSKRLLVEVGLLVICLPLILYITAGLPWRTPLKESISLLTLLAFTVMPAQFILSRGGAGLYPDTSLRTIITTHKVVGYLVLPFILLHPLLIVLPRFFEAGVAPGDAWFTIITTVDNPGILTGMAAWLLLLTIGITSFFRDRLFASYRRWRVAHAVLSTLFLCCGAYHVIALGRHISFSFRMYIIFTTVVGLALLLQRYAVVPNTQLSQEVTS